MRCIECDPLLKIAIVCVEYRIVSLDFAIKIHFIIIQKERERTENFYPHPLPLPKERNREGVTCSILMPSRDA